MRKQIVVAIAVALLAGSATQAQTRFGSPGAAFAEGVEKALARQEEQRRQEEQERLAREYLELEKRLVRLREQQTQAAQATPAEPTKSEAKPEKVQYMLVTRAQLAELVTYLHDAGLSDDQPKAVVLMLVE